MQPAELQCFAGNLTLGVVTDMMLRELFNGALAHLVPNPQTNPPVVNAQLDPTGKPHRPASLLTTTGPSTTTGPGVQPSAQPAAGRFGFVEMRTEELATSAMQLDKVICPEAYLGHHAHWAPASMMPGLH